jgi:hypothetical protein
MGMVFPGQFPDLVLPEDEVHVVPMHIASANMNLSGIFSSDRAYICHGDCGTGRRFRKACLPSLFSRSGSVNSALAYTVKKV